MMREMYFEDFAIGDRFSTPGTTVTEAQIIDFALHWDPQLFHIDVEAARNHEMEGLLASGLHTLCLTFRLFLQTGVLAHANITGPGLDNLRWLKPVRPGDTLRVEAEITDIRPSRSRKDRGTLIMHYRTFNQRQEPVLSFEMRHIVRRRPAAL